MSGVGEVSAVPDLAILTAGVEATAKTVQEARNQAAEAMDRMMQALTDQGVTAEEIQTRFFNISPEYIWNRTKEQQELVGYRVSNQISVKIRDLGSTGLIIDELAVAGGDLARIQGISFTVEDTNDKSNGPRGVCNGVIWRVTADGLENGPASRGPGEYSRGLLALSDLGVASLNSTL